MKRITAITFRAGFSDESRVTGETRRRPGGLTRKQLGVAAAFWENHVTAIQHRLHSLHGTAKKRYIMFEIEREA